MRFAASVLAGALLLWSRRLPALLALAAFLHAPTWVWTLRIPEGLASEGPSDLPRFHFWAFLLLPILLLLGHLLVLHRVTAPLTRAGRPAPASLSRLARSLPAVLVVCLVLGSAGLGLAVALRLVVPSLVPGRSIAMRVAQAVLLSPLFTALPAATGGGEGPMETLRSAWRMARGSRLPLAFLAALLAGTSQLVMRSTEAQLEDADWIHTWHITSLVSFLGPQLWTTLAYTVAWQRLRPRATPEATAEVFA